MTFEQLQQLVLSWAEAKGILVEHPNNAVAQVKKMLEEVEELQSELLGVQQTLSSNHEACDDHYYKSVMELGDVLVTVIITSYCAGIEPLDALAQAVVKISKRTGNVVNGIFVKDEAPSS